MLVATDHVEPPISRCHGARLRARVGGGPSAAWPLARRHADRRAVLRYDDVAALFRGLELRPGRGALLDIRRSAMARCCVRAATSSSTSRARSTSACAASSCRRSAPRSRRASPADARQDRPADSGVLGPPTDPCPATASRTSPIRRSHALRPARHPTPRSPRSGDRPPIGLGGHVRGRDPIRTSRPRSPGSTRSPTG